MQEPDALEQMLDAAAATGRFRTGQQVSNEERPVVNLRGASAAAEAAELRRRRAAARRILRVYQGFRMRRLFQHLKQVLARTEQSLTPDLLRRLSPREADILLDPVQRAYVRFRFGGTRFPPTIYYKIYTSKVSTVTMTGGAVIAPGSQAARDACRAMGNRRFLEQLVVAEGAKAAFNVAEVYQVGDRADLVRLRNCQDELPVHLGGRGNNWRSLNTLPLVAQQQVWRSMVLRVTHSDGGGPPLNQQLTRQLMQYVRQQNLFGPSTGARLRAPGPATPTPAQLKLQRWRELFASGDNSGGGDSLGAVHVPVEAETGDFAELYEWATGLSEDWLHPRRDLVEDSSVALGAP